MRRKTYKIRVVQDGNYHGILYKPQIKGLFIWHDISTNPNKLFDWSDGDYYDNYSSKEYAIEDAKKKLDEFFLYKKRQRKRKQEKRQIIKYTPLTRSGSSVE